MVFSGLVIGTIMYLGFIGIWYKLPPLLKLVTLWSPLMADIVISGGVILITAGVSSSITGLTAGLWCGLLVTLSLTLGAESLREQARAERRKQRPDRGTRGSDG